VAAAKGREPAEGIILGFVFGPLGCLIEALLPTLPPRDSAPRPGAKAKGKHHRPLPSPWADPEPADDWTDPGAMPDDDGEERARAYLDGLAGPPPPDALAGAIERGVNDPAAVRVDEERALKLLGDVNRAGQVAWLADRFREYLAIP
jgi:hypothetical protein